MDRVVCLYLLASLTAAAAVEPNELRKSAEARTMFEKVMSNFLSRTGASTSQVLSLNLSNLLILILLKALIFAAGSIGAGGWKGYGYGRSLDDEDNELVSDTEILLYLGYITGSPGKYQCLQNIACHRPKQAKQYAKAGEILWNSAQVMQSVLKVDPGHEQALQALKEAADYGLTRKDCDAKYICSNKAV